MILKNKYFKRYLENTSWMLVERVFRMLTNFLVSILIARYLGPENFGLLSYLLSFAGLFITIATLELEAVLVADLASKKNHKYELLGTAIILRFIAAIISIAAIVIVSILVAHHDKTENIYVLIIGVSYIFNSFTVIESYFQSIVKIKYLVPSFIFQSILASLIKLVFIYVDAPFSWFVWAILIDSVILSLGFLITYIATVGSIRLWEFNFKLSKRLLLKCWPLIISGLMISIYMKIDQVMLKHLLNDFSVGQYAVGVKLVEVWYFLPMSIAASLFPALISSKSSGNKNEFDYRMQQFYTLMIWQGILISIPISYLAPYLVKFLYGYEYIEAGEVLRIYIWATIFVFFGVARSKWVIIESQQIYTIIYLSSGAVINITFNYYLIPLYGGVGAAYSTIISLIASIVFIPIFINKLQRKQVTMFFVSFYMPYLSIKKYLKQGM